MEPTRNLPSICAANLLLHLSPLCETGPVSTTVAGLARETGYSERAIQKALASLEAAGAVQSPRVGHQRELRAHLTHPWFAVAALVAPAAARTWAAQS
jgi:hypothetical protein